MLRQLQASKEAELWDLEALTIPQALELLPLVKKMKAGLPLTAEEQRSAESLISIARRTVLAV